MKQAPAENSNIIDRKRQQLAAEAARQAGFDGWTEISLRAAARKLGWAEGEIALLFPEGVPDWIRQFEAGITQQMLNRVAAERGFEAFKVREKIAFCVKARLEYLKPFREAVRRLQGAFVFPPSRMLLALKTMHDTTDRIWRACGDASTDFNYYTKRGLLAGVYASTQLYWLNDNSPDNAASWAFLDRRIADVLKIGGAIGRFRKKDQPK